MLGVEVSIVGLAVVIALLGLVPCAMALAADRQQDRGVVGHYAAAGQERVEFPDRSNHRNGQSEPQRRDRLKIGTMARQDRFEEDCQRLAAAAPVDPAAAIVAAGRAGYRLVTMVEWERGSWALRARNAAGASVWLRVDGWTGQVAPLGMLSSGRHG